MHKLCFASLVAAAITSPMITSIVGVDGSAAASTPIGSCTDSYTSYRYDQLSFDPDAQAIFGVTDANGDGVICFKLYPNGPHNGHLGNLVDDKAAPHG